MERKEGKDEKENKRYLHSKSIFHYNIPVNQNRVYEQ